MKGKERKSEMTTEETEIEVASGSVDADLVFHIVSDILAFLLYMQQQIPSILQDMLLEFDSLQTKYKELETVLTQSELNASSRRKHIGRKRGIKLEIRRVEKFMSSISGLQNAFQQMICEVPNVKDIIFVFGASPRRPQHAYEICFPHGRMAPQVSEEMTKSKTAELLSKKVIRALITKCVGSASYSGPSKLFLLVKAPASFNMPLHFLPMREFQYTKKIIPFRLQIKSRTYHQDVDASSCVSHATTSFNTKSDISSDLMWFQCRHVIKGLANPSTEE